MAMRRTLVTAGIVWKMAAAAFWCIFFGSGCSTLFPMSLVGRSGGFAELDFDGAQIAPAASAVSGDPVFVRQPVFEAIPGKQGSHAAAITAFGDGELLAAWYSYDGPHELNGSAIYMARKPADQPVWGEPWLHIDRPCGDGNPVLYAEGDKVWFFQAVTDGGWSIAHIEMQISPDRGRTWSTPQALFGPLGSNTRFPPVRASDGTLLLPAYSDLLHDSVFWACADGGDCWPLGEISTQPPCIQPSVAVLPDGRLLAVMRNTGRGFLWVMSSDDQGRSWSQPIDSGFPNPDSPAALQSLASGNLLLVFNDGPTERRPLSAALSSDYGRTWSVRKVLADGEESYSYPTVVQDSDGMIHVLFSLERRRIEHVAFNEAWLVSAEPAAGHKLRVGTRGVQERGGRAR